jgi:gamma-glutamylcyclotransferase (GGCT)/AIG2-like uncharacterized protein YtfP
MIPFGLAGTGCLFLYGTLTDNAVLGRVLNRPLQADAQESALLIGFHRRRALGANYPLLVPLPDAAVCGLILRDLSRRDIGRLNHFEAGEYRAERHKVRLQDGSTCTAWVYVALPGLIPSSEPWDLATWQREHKQAFLAECDQWMADCPEPD